MYVAWIRQLFYLPRIAYVIEMLRYSLFTLASWYHISPAWEHIYIVAIFVYLHIFLLRKLNEKQHVMFSAQGFYHFLSEYDIYQCRLKTTEEVYPNLGVEILPQSHKRTLRRLLIGQERKKNSAKFCCTHLLPFLASNNYSNDTVNGGASQNSDMQPVTRSCQKILLHLHYKYRKFVLNGTTLQ